MADIQITRIARSSNTHESITHLGTRTGWWTKAQVIASIDAGTNTFFTFVGGRRANIGVVNGATGRYLRTYADRVWNDNLLALPTAA
ncbi:DUF3892 domain-containing protein [Sorangium sp. So ce1389]|uniref:DUF3892 domain-containing protein n=1 Tax=Sorangium sp. So ce1389 TaxID=3133336 RepID=UPI003F5E7307